MGVWYCIELILQEIIEHGLRSNCDLGYLLTEIAGVNSLTAPEPL